MTNANPVPSNANKSGGPSTQQSTSPTVPGFGVAMNELYRILLNIQESGLGVGARRLYCRAECESHEFPDAAF